MSGNLLFLEAALLVQSNVVSALQALTEEVDRILDVGETIPTAATAFQEATSALNHNGFHFSEWEVVAQLLGVDLLC